MSYSIKLNIGSVDAPVFDGGYVTVNAILDGNGIIKKRDNKQFAKVRKELKKEIDFIGDEYRALQTLKDAGNKYVECKIYYNSNERLYGYIIFSGNFNENENKCSLQFQTVDQYSDFDKNLDVEQNIITYANEDAYIRTNSILYEITLPCFNGNFLEAQLYYDPDGNVSLDTGVAHPDWAYYTLTNTETCVGGELFTFVTTYVDFPASGYVQSQLWLDLYLKKRTSIETFRETVPKAADLYTVLERLIEKTESDITITKSTYSDFLNNTSSVLYNLKILDKSDAKRPTASNPATFEIITLSRLLELYRDWFVLSYKIDESGNFYLVRRGYITEPNYTTYPKHDLTNYKNTNFTNNQKIYKTNVDNKYDKEILKFESQDSFIFSKSTLDYQLYYKNEQTFDYSEFNNNISYLIDDPEEISDEGFTILACNSGNDIFNTGTTGAIIVNGYMSASGIVSNFIKTSGRPFETALSNGVLTTCNKLPDREVNYKNIPIYDIDDINFDYYVKTDLGLMEVNEFEIAFDKSFSKLKMIY